MNIQGDAPSQSTQTNELVITDSLARGVLRDTEHYLHTQNMQLQHYFQKRLRWRPTSVADVSRVCNNYKRQFTELGFTHFTLANDFDKTQQIMHVLTPILSESRHGKYVFYSGKTLLFTSNAVHVLPFSFTGLQVTWHAIQRLFQRLRTLEARLAFQELTPLVCAAYLYPTCIPQMKQFKCFAFLTTQGYCVAELGEQTTIKTFYRADQLKGRRLASYQRMKMLGEQISLLNQTGDSPKPVEIGEAMLQLFPSWTRDYYSGFDAFGSAQLHRQAQEKQAVHADDEVVC